MLPNYQTSMLNHFKAVGDWARANKATASISIPEGILTVRYRDRVLDFQPQFRSTTPDGAPIVWMEVQERSSGFFGWLPYFNKTWPAARSKQHFKAIANRFGIRTPRWGKDSRDMDAYLIKSEFSSFGEGIAGPFREGARGVGRQLNEGQFVEEFVEGQILKTLFWNAQLAVIECYSPATIIGDGHRSIGELVAARPKMSPRPVNFDVVQAMLALHNRKIDDVPAREERVVVDFRYGSALFDLTFKNTNCLGTMPSEVVDQLMDAGRRLESAIPIDVRRNTAFSVDGVLDGEGRVWFLEMNCNPHLHPDIYSQMLNSLFEDEYRIPEELKPLHLRSAMNV